MARIRSIKPEFWDDEKVSKLSLRSRLLFIGLWNYCDDIGVCRAAPRFLQSKIFPFEDLSIAEMAGCLAELSQFGFIYAAEHEHQALLLVKNFVEHQVINKPSKYRVHLQTYDENEAWFKERSGSTPVVVSEDYAGELGARKGARIPVGAEISAAPVPAKADPKFGDAIGLYRERFQHVHGRQPDIGGRHASAIKALVKQFGLEKTCESIDGFFQLPDLALHKRCHPPWDIAARWEEIKSFQISGKFVPWHQVRAADKALGEVAGPVDPWEKIAIDVFGLTQNLSIGVSREHEEFKNRLEGYKPGLYDFLCRALGGLNKIWAWKNDPRGKGFFAQAMRDKSNQGKQSQLALDLPVDRPLLE